MKERKIRFSHLDSKKCVGVIFDNYGKCPKCGSQSKRDMGLFDVWQEYECLMCGTQWQEPCEELKFAHETEQ